MEGTDNKLMMRVREGHTSELGVLFERHHERLLNYLLRMTGRDCDVRLRGSDKPEFDAWRWHDYWVPLEAVIEFKREVYRQALAELHRFLGTDRRRPARQEAAEAP